MLCSGWHNIYASRFYTGMSENIRKLCYVLFNSVKHSCKQMSQIMGKHFIKFYLCFASEIFHFFPYIDPINRSACARDKNASEIYIASFLRCTQKLLIIFSFITRCFIAIPFGCFSLFYPKKILLALWWKIFQTKISRRFNRYLRLIFIYWLNVNSWGRKIRKKE